jgi:nitrogen-specific signal transduction histidine kinase
VSAEIIQLAGTPCILAIINDITESRRLEEQLRQAQKMEAIGRLAGGVAHDFNNVLGVIIGYSELAQDIVDQGNPIYDQLREIKKAADRAASLTRQLLAFSRQQILQPASHNLNAIVDNLLKMLKRMVAEDVEVSFVAGSPLGNIYVDRGQIEQILMNLAVNARDAMPEGGKLIIETADADLDQNYAKQHAPLRPGPYVRLSVTDNGVGMDSVTLRQIFEPFFTTKEMGRGTGLGLSIVYGIVKQSGGYIWVYSEPGHGTSFKIYFPRIEAPAELLSESHPEEVHFAGTETILLVEDDDALRNLAVRLLRTSGYKVLEAADAAIAIDLAKKYDGQIKMLLSDVILSKVSGPELAQTLRSFCPDLKVILMSGYAGDIIARRGVLDSKTVFIEKPFTKTVLLSRVRSVLDSKVL